MKKVVVLTYIAVLIIPLITYAYSLSDLNSSQTEIRVETAQYLGEKAENEGLSEEELIKLIELADDPDDEVRAAGRDAVLRNTNLELVENWAERYKTRGNYYGVFICYANVYSLYSEKYENTADAEVKAIFKSDRDKAQLEAKEVYKKIKGTEKKDLAAPVYTGLQ
jgi:hypothetical protein